MSQCGGELVANELLNTLLDGKVFEIPDIDLNDADYSIPSAGNNPLFSKVNQLTNEDLTTRTVNGQGTFDALMESIGNHIKNEFTQNRITGAEYTKAYVALVQSALGSSVQYLLGKDQAYWSAIQAQAQAQLVQVQMVKARIDLEIAKIQAQLAKYETLGVEANYALTKMRIATEEATRCDVISSTALKNFQLSSVMPAEVENLIADNDIKKFQLSDILPTEKASLVADVSIKEFQRNSVLPAELNSLNKDVSIKEFQLSSMLPAERDNIIADKNIKTYQVTDILPSEKANVIADTNIKTYTASNLLPAQRDNTAADTAQRTYQTANILPAERSNILADVAIKEYQVQNILPIEKEGIQADTDGKIFTTNAILPSQKKLLDNQAFSQAMQGQSLYADISDFSYNNDWVGEFEIKGLKGAQKELYTQQRESYMRDAEIKAAKMFTDAWITQKTIDEGLTAPNMFTNATLDQVMGSIKTKNDL